ncbi:MAG: hypothetical protein NTV05_12825 [Acidobacteria bacterium]|nr:hypothetical protein [Acidobacteriota bacterium]
MTRRFLTVVACIAAAAACGGKTQSPVSPSPTGGPAAGCARTSIGQTPLNDLAGGTYKGERGGLYPGGTNARTGSHEAEGLARARAIVPVTAAGAPDGRGRYALVSIGMSNTTMEFSAFKQHADSDPSKDPHLAIVDGAQGGQTAVLWSSPACSCWATLDARLAAAGISAKQVSVVWLKEADANPMSGWPIYAQTLKNEMAQMLSLLAARFPRLRMVYLSSRIYAGYATSALNPEPYAFESAFSVRWLIEDQMQGGGGLAYGPGDNTIPWLGWGPYLWADGITPRSDGLSWTCSDLSSSDGTHPSASGQQKVAQMLLTFFQTDLTARAWYLVR